MRVTQKTLRRYAKALLIAQGFPNSIVGWTEFARQSAATWKAEDDEEFWIVLFDFEKLTRVPHWIIPIIVHEIGHVVSGHTFMTSVESAEYEATLWAAQYFHHIKDKANLIGLCDLVRKGYGSPKADIEYWQASKILVPKIVSLLKTLN